MNHTLCVLSILLLGTIYSFRIGPSFLTNGRSRHQYQLQSSVFAMPSVGDVVLAEVVDIGGSVVDPIAFFRLKDCSDRTEARMSTKHLSAAERLALQAGSVMQVKVCNADGNELHVEFADNTDSGNQYVSTRDRNSKPVPKSATRSITRQLNGFQVPGTYSQTSTTTASTTTVSTASITMQRPPTKKTETKPKVPGKGKLLNNLKTGMPLNGTVVSSTPYAAFVNAKVYRPGKGGRFVEVVGMLHRSDIPKDALKRADSSSSSSKTDSKTDKSLLTRGAVLPVYVKEVLKNSGRFTLTMDATIDKQRVVQAKEQSKEDGKNRRRSRRLRLVLQNVVAGQTVSGVVERVTGDGVYVTVTSLSALNVTGLIPRRSLPKQFEVPADMKPSFQAQLLQQDFSIDRPISCCVNKVPQLKEDTSRPAAPFQLELVFEQFDGKAPLDELVINDVGDLYDDTNDEDDEDSSEFGVEDEEEFDDEALLAEDADIDDDIRDIFDELRGNKPLLAVDDIFAWADVQDMITDGSITEAGLETAISDALQTEAVSMDLSMTLVQFNTFIERLQDAIDAEDGSAVADAGSVSKSETSASTPATKVSVTPLPPTTVPVTKIPTAPLPTTAILVAPLPTTAIPVAPLPATKIPAAATTATTVMNKVDDDLYDESFREVARELFDELRGKNKQLPVSAIKQWDDVKDMLQAGVFATKELERAIAHVKGLSSKSAAVKDSDTLSFKEFFQLIDDIEKLAEAAAVATDDNTVDHNTDNESSATSVMKAEMTTSKQPQQQETSGDDDEDDEDDEEDMDELIREIFDELRGKGNKVTLKVVQRWEDVQAMIEQEVLTADEVEALFSYVTDGDSSQGLDLRQFTEFVELLDGAGGDFDDDADFDNAEDTEVVTSSQNNNSSINDEEEDDDEDMTDEEFDEAMADLFQDLKGKKGLVSLQAFKDWPDVQEMVQEGVLTTEQIDELYATVAASSKAKTAGLNVEQFKALARAVDEAADEAQVASFNNDDDDEDEEEVADSMEGATDDEEGGEEDLNKEIFDELSTDGKTVAVKDFLKWDELQDLQNEGFLDADTLKILVEEVGSNMKGKLTFAQFSNLLDMVDETANAMADSEDDAAMDYTNMDDDDEEGEDITQQVLSERTRTASASSNSAGKPTTAAAVAKTLDDDDDAEEEDGEEEEEDDDEVVAREVYDELRGKSPKLSTKKFKEWEEMQLVLENDLMSAATLDTMIEEVADGGKTLSFEQFMQLTNLVDEACEIAEGGSDGLGDGDEPSDEEIEEMARMLFDELKNSKTGKVSVKKFKNWEGIKGEIDDGRLSKGAVESALQHVGVTPVGKGRNEAGEELSFEQFKQAMDFLEAVMDTNESDDEKDDEEEDEDEDDSDDTSPPKLKPTPTPTASVSAAPSGKGFARTPEQISERVQSKADKKAGGIKYDESDEAYAISKELFSELSKNGKTIKVAELREWPEVQDMVDSGALKLSQVEQALQKVGALQSGKVDFDQFYRFIDLIQANVDVEDLDIDVDQLELESGSNSNTLKSSKNSRVLDADAVKDVSQNTDDEGDDEDDDDEDEDNDLDLQITDEDMAREVYDELRGSNQKLSLQQFIQWEDVQELLDSGAVSRDDLADCIEKSGANIEDDSESTIEFETFNDLLQLIDGVVNQDVLMAHQDSIESDLDLTEDSSTTTSSSGGSGNSKKSKRNKVSDDYDEIELKPIRVQSQDVRPTAVDDPEIIEMFEDISKGKTYISEKQLRKWDELQELIESEMMSQDILEQYIARLQLDRTNGRIDVDTFAKFVGMLDSVLLDDGGNVLGPDDEGAVDLDAYDLEDEDDE